VSASKKGGGGVVTAPFPSTSKNDGPSDSKPACQLS
jgi:hypothetical protein